MNKNLVRALLLASVLPMGAVSSINNVYAAAPAAGDDFKTPTKQLAKVRRQKDELPLTAQIKQQAIVAVTVLNPDNSLTPETEQYIVRQKEEALRRQRDDDKDNLDRQEKILVREQKLQEFKKAEDEQKAQELAEIAEKLRAHEEKQRAANEEFEKIKSAKKKLKEDLEKAEADLAQEQQAKADLEAGLAQEQQAKAGLEAGLAQEQQAKADLEADLAKAQRAKEVLKKSAEAVSAENDARVKVLKDQLNEITDKYLDAQDLCAQLAKEKQKMEEKEKMLSTVFDQSLGAPADASAPKARPIIAGIPMANLGGQS